MSDVVGIWRISKTPANAYEIVDTRNENVTYVADVTKADIRLGAYENKILLEEIYVTRALHEVIVQSRDSSVAFFRCVIKASNDTTISHIIANNDQFLLETPSKDHASALNSKLAELRRPQIERLSKVVSAIKDDKAFKSEFSKETGFGAPLFARVDLPNGIIVACTVACGLCGLGQFEFCVACSICVEM